MSKGKSCSHQQTINEFQGCVSLVPIFNHLEPEQLDEIMQVVQSINLQKGDHMYYAGDESKALYIVHQGQVKIYRLSETGKEQVVRLLNPGDFTGELALFQQTVHEAYAEAMTKTQICMIQREDLQRLLLKYPTISLKVLTEFATRLDHSEKQTTSVATESVETRIALFIAELFDQNEPGNTTVRLPMSKRDLASFLGTTPETLSRRLTEFQRAGLIEQEGQRKIIVHDIDRLLLS